jgi:hypothetical protein
MAFGCLICIYFRSHLCTDLLEPLAFLCDMPELLAARYVNFINNKGNLLRTGLPCPGHLLSFPRLTETVTFLRRYATGAGCLLRRVNFQVAAVYQGTPLYGVRRISFVSCVPFTLHESLGAVITRRVPCRWKAVMTVAALCPCHHLSTLQLSAPRFTLWTKALFVSQKRYFLRNEDGMGWVL